MSSSYEVNYDGTLQCPYDPSHRIQPNRMPFHLVRCGRNRRTSDMVTCPYVSTHRYRENEAIEHFKVCEGRKVDEVYRAYRDVVPAKHGDLSSPLVFGSEMIAKWQNPLTVDDDWSDLLVGNDSSNRINGTVKDLSRQGYSDVRRELVKVEKPETATGPSSRFQPKRFQIVDAVGDGKTRSGQQKVKNPHLENPSNAAKKPEKYPIAEKPVKARVAEKPDENPNSVKHPIAENSAKGGCGQKPVENLKLSAAAKKPDKKLVGNSICQTNLPGCY